MSKKFIPMCWNCVNGLWADNVDDPIPIRRMNPQVFKGCKKRAKIVTYDGAKKFCPLKKKR